MGTKSAGEGKNMGKARTSDSSDGTGKGNPGRKPQPGPARDRRQITVKIPLWIRDEIDFLERKTGMGYTSLVRRLLNTYAVPAIKQLHDDDWSSLKTLGEEPSMEEEEANGD